MDVLTVIIVAVFVALIALDGGPAPDQTILMVLPAAQPRQRGNGCTLILVGLVAVILLGLLLSR